MRPASSGLEAGDLAVRELLRKGTAFDAIVTSSDLVALGAIRVLRGEGLSVPEDVAVVGYTLCAQPSPPCASTAPRSPAPGAARICVTVWKRRADGIPVASRARGHAAWMEQSGGRARGEVTQQSAVVNAA